MRDTVFLANSDEAVIGSRACEDGVRRDLVKHCSIRRKVQVTALEYGGHRNG